MTPARKPQQEDGDGSKPPNDKYKLLIWAVERVGLPTILTLGIGWVMVTYWIGPQQEERIGLRASQQILIDSQQKVSIGQQETINSLVMQTGALRSTLEKLTEVVNVIATRQTVMEEAVLINQKILTGVQQIESMQTEQNKNLQIIVTEMLATLTAAKEMMAPVPEMRKKTLQLNEEQTIGIEELKKMQKETLEELKKKNASP